MSAITSIAVISAISALIRSKPLRTLGSRVSELAKSSSDAMGEAIGRALRMTETSHNLTELPSLPTAFEQVANLERDALAKLRAHTEPLSSFDIEKTATIAAVLGAPLVADDAGRIHAALAAVDAARDELQLDSARNDLKRVIRAEHGAVWLDGLKDATQRAFDAVGFRSMRVTGRSAREIHLSAINSDGKVLVSELRLAKDGTPSMATEVVNGCGPDCDAILADFEKALAEYVRGTTPVRKPTGGVCQLEAAVDFVRRRVRRPPVQNAGAAKTRKTKTVVQKG